MIINDLLTKNEVSEFLYKLKSAIVDRAPVRNGCAYARSNKSTINDESIANLIFGCLYVELSMDLMEHRINWCFLGISRIICDF